MAGLGKTANGKPETAMGEGEELRRIVSLRTKSQPNRTDKLGDVVKELMDKRISPRHTIFSSVVESWEQLLPSELGSHCEIVDISGGCLKVAADSPSYTYELRLCSRQILKELQRQCPRARIRKIEFVVTNRERK